MKNITTKAPFMNCKWLISYHYCSSNSQDPGTLGDTIRPSTYECIEKSNVTSPGAYDTCDNKESGYTTVQWQYSVNLPKYENESCDMFFYTFVLRMTVINCFVFFLYQKYGCLSQRMKTTHIENNNQCLLIHHVVRHAYYCPPLIKYEFPNFIPPVVCFNQYNILHLYYRSHELQGWKTENNEK